MAEAAGDNAPIIVKKIKKGGHAGHHGGAWKVAYADFVTAMMAFFLLLWLINATTEEQKRGIAEYFSPVPGAVGETTGGTGFFKGNSVTSEGPMTNANAPVTVTIPIPTTSFKEDKSEGDQEKKAAPDNKDQADDTSQSSASNKDDQNANTDPEQAAKVLADLEDKQFKEAANLLRQAIQQVPDLKDLAENLIIDNTPEGLRIQIVDQEKLAMFPRGSTTMTDKAKLLMQQVAKVIEKMPEKIAISGHTDSTQYATGGKTYDNWDLSTDRANASRRALIEAGLTPERITNLAGKADTQPLDKGDPSSPRNRRISITLLRDNKLPGKEADSSDTPAPASSAAPAPAQTPPGKPKG